MISDYLLYSDVKDRTLVGESTLLKHMDVLNLFGIFETLSFLCYLFLPETVFFTAPTDTKNWSSDDKVFISSGGK